MVRAKALLDKTERALRVRARLVEVTERNADFGARPEVNREVRMLRRELSLAQGNRVVRVLEGEGQFAPAAERVGDVIRDERDDRRVRPACPLVEDARF